MGKIDPELVESVITFLDALGYRCALIPTADRETCDLVCDCGDGKLLVEVKRRLDPDDRATVLDSGAHYSRERSTLFDSSVDKTMRKAKSQLSTTAKSHGNPAHQVIWLIDAQIPPFEQFVDQVAGVLYGLREAAYGADELDGNAESNKIWGSRAGRFRRMPNVTAVVVQMPRGHALLVNPWAADSESFRLTSLFKMFGTRGGLFDPSADGSKSGFLISDRIYSDKEEPLLREYLRTRYGYNWLWVVDMAEHSVEVQVPKHGVRTRPHP